MNLHYGKFVPYYKGVRQNLACVCLVVLSILFLHDLWYSKIGLYLLYANSFLLITFSTSRFHIPNPVLH